MICFKCGAQNEEDSVFCGNCGANLKEANSNMGVFNQPVNNQSAFTQMNTSVSNEPVKNDNKSFNFKILIILAIFAIAAVVILVIFNPFGKDKNNTNNATKSNIDVSELIPVKKDKKYGYIDLAGNFQIPAKYDEADDFHGNYAVVGAEIEKDGKSQYLYQIIDMKGNVIKESEYKTDFKYYEDENIWVIDDKLYDSSLKKLTDDNIHIFDVSNGYIEWSNYDNDTEGIMLPSGKITYSYQLNDEFSNVFLDASKITNNNIKEKYCVIALDFKKYGIINCDTGKVVYDFGDKKISSDRNNVFEIMDDNYKVEGGLYIHNDEIVYQTAEGEEISTYNDEYAQIYDKDSIFVTKAYIDYYDGKVVTEKPNRTYLTDWEEHTKLIKFEKDYKYGLKSGEDIKLDSEWSDIKFLDLDIYKYLKSQGKDIVLASKDYKTYIIDLSTGEAIDEINSSYVDIGKSTFIEYRDNDERYVYSLITGKSKKYNDIGVHNHVNYFTEMENHNKNYYNANMELIYTESN